MSLLFYGYSSRTLSRSIKNAIWGLPKDALLKKPWNHSTKPQGYCHLPTVSQTIPFSQKRYTGHYWRSKNGYMNHVPLSSPIYELASDDRLARTTLVVTVTAGVAEYTDCFKRRGKTPPRNAPDMTLNYLMVMFQWCWVFGQREVPLHCHHSKVHSELEW